ncbi:MAG: YiiX/YebB-like N1pC/P60 family cysteine hydrolase [Limnobacter sp.]|uniref:YiiX/YebB-like N1pC/P60 family cysteine hydrolase n=1 Tax=Limnobacter sp. TaxID=2003368 RepID=UPI00391CA7DE
MTTQATCQAGDILVTASASLNSTAIQNGTCTTVSHAVLMIDHINAVEAVPEGVIPSNLSKSLRESSKVILLRHKHMTHAQGTRIAQYALKQVGKPYDTLGAARAGANSGCSGAFKYTAPGMLITLVDELSKSQSGHETSFFCSELVAMAYRSVGLALSSKQPWVTLPGGLLRSDQLVMVDQLK